MYTFLFLHNKLSQTWLKTIYISYFIVSTGLVSEHDLALCFAVKVVTHLYCHLEARWRIYFQAQCTFVFWNPSFAVYDWKPQLFVGNLLEAAFMFSHSSTLAWKIPWTEEPGRLQSMGSLGVRHNSATSLSLFTFMHWRRKWQPTPVFLPGESRDGGAWWAAVSGVAQSRTWLMRLSSSSSSSSSFYVLVSVSFLP